LKYKNSWSGLRTIRKSHFEACSYRGSRDIAFLVFALRYRHWYQHVGKSQQPVSGLDCFFELHNCFTRLELNLASAWSQN
jgi:hypothetical protein